MRRAVSVVALCLVLATLAACSSGQDTPGQDPPGGEEPFSVNSEPTSSPAADREFGRGFNFDEQGKYTKAVYHYRKAAEMGQPFAMFNLGMCYADGTGVPQDNVLAHMWFNLAAAQHPPGKHRDRATHNRDIFAIERMTRAQVSEAQRLARAWRPKDTRQPEEQAVVTPRVQTPPTDSQTTPPDSQTSPTEEHLTGSGFVVSAEGHVVTNHHVVEGCREVRVANSGKVARLAVDTVVDLALLKIKTNQPNRATLRGGRGVRVGEDIIVAGYPLQGLLASDMSVTKGILSSLAGPGDDRRIIQITAPVQMGNSGGPVLDNSGNVVGVVVGRLDALKMANLTGALPQNVNFAISEGTVRAFLDAHDVPYDTAPSQTPMSGADIAAKAKRFTVLVDCWK